MTGLDAAAGGRTIARARSERNEPLTHAEAVDILARLRVPDVIKRMPAAPMTTRREADRRIVARQLASLVLDQVAACEAAEAAIETPAEDAPAATGADSPHGETMIEEQTTAPEPPAPTSDPSDEVPYGYLEIAKQALNDVLRDKTDAVAVIGARFERLCSEAGISHDADLTCRAVAAAITARDRALDAFAAQVRAFVKPMPTNRRGNRR